MWKLILAAAVLAGLVFFKECRKPPREQAVPSGNVVMPAPANLNRPPNRVVHADPNPLPPPVPYVAPPAASGAMALPPGDTPPKRPPERAPLPDKDASVRRAR